MRGVEVGEEVVGPAGRDERDRCLGTRGQSARGRDLQQASGVRPGRIRASRRHAFDRQAGIEGEQQGLEAAIRRRPHLEPEIQMKLTAGIDPHRCR